MKRPVLFLDSGIGGLPYLAHFHRRRPNIPLLYCADRQNFPYGPRSREELIRIVLDLAGHLGEHWRPRLGVIACNTASVSCLEALRRRFPQIPWVGTVPAVKPALLASRTGVVGVLGTERTVQDPCIQRLAAALAGRVVALAAPDLVDFVENRLDAASGSAASAEVAALAAPYIARFREESADGIVLGCTHFLHISAAIAAAAAPDLAVYDSLEGISRRVEFLLDQTEETEEDFFNIFNFFKNTLLVTGSVPPEARWKTWAERFGLTLKAESW